MKNINSDSNDLTPDEYNYVDRAFGSVTNRNNVQHIADINVPIDMADCYISMFNFKEEYKELCDEIRSVKGANKFACSGGYLWFDIDSLDLDKALVEVRSLIVRIEHFVPEIADALHLSFSGSKGFHVGIPAGLIGWKPSVDLPRICKRMAVEIAGSGVAIDTSIYEHNRLWRMLNTQNSKSGLYKVALTYDEIATWSIDQIKEKAAAPAGKPSVTAHVHKTQAPSKKLVQLYGRIKSDLEQRMFYKKASQVPSISKPCMERLLEGMPEGHRSEAAIRIASEFHKGGQSKEQIYSKLSEWNLKNESPLDDSEIVCIVDSAFDSEYDYGCNDPLLSSLCNADCAMASKRPPTVKQDVMYSFTFNEWAETSPNKFHVTDIADQHEALTRLKQPALLIEKSDKPATIPKCFDSAEIIFLISMKPTQWYQFAERIGEKCLITECDGTIPSCESDLSEQINSAVSYGNHRLDLIETLPQYERMSELKKVLPYLRTLDLIELSLFRERLKTMFGMPVATVKSWLEKPAETVVAEVVEEEPEFTEADLAEAEDLLMDPRLLDRFLGDIEKAGCIGEEDNKLMVFLSLTSRLLKKPISLTIKGESSGGKSFMVESTASFFPREEVIQYTSVSSKALLYRKDDLQHKGLIIFERHGSEDSDYNIRSLQSEGVLRGTTTIRNEETGQFEAQEFEINGPIAYIETTTQANIHAENETRCFDLYVDESQQQTINVMKTQAQRYMGSVVNKEHIVSKWKALQTLLEHIEVRIPFADLIKFPSHRVRSRRDFPRFLSLIEVIAFVRQRQKDCLGDDDYQYILADIEDYERARQLAENILIQTLKEVAPSVEVLLTKAEGLSDQLKDDNHLTVEQLTEALGWNKRKTQKCVKQACDAGYLEYVDRTKGRAFSYRFKKKPDGASGELLTVEELRQAMEVKNNA